MCINKKVVERPQQMLMRVAVTLHGDDIQNVIDTYNVLSNQLYLHCPQTLLEAGKDNGHMIRFVISSIC